MAVISGVLKGPMGDARVGVVIELRAVRTSATVVIQARSQSVTDATGRYTLSVEPGQYDVMITAAGRQPERVGGIQVMVNSATGTLNDFLTIPGETDLNPAIVATVDGMRAAAAASAAAAKTSENNAAATLTNSVKRGEFGIGGVTPALPLVDTLNSLKKLQTGKYVSWAGGVDMPRSDVAYTIDWTLASDANGLIQGVVLATAIITAPSTYDQVYRNVCRNSIFQGWKIVWDENSLSNPLRPGDFGIGATLQNNSDGLDIDTTNLPMGFYAGNNLKASIHGVPPGIPTTGTNYTYLQHENLSTGYGQAALQRYVAHGQTNFGVWFRNKVTGVWNDWFKVAFDNTEAQIVPPSVVSSVNGARYCKIAEQAPSATTALGVHFKITGGRSFAAANPNLDIMHVYFSARNATAASLTPTGLQVLRTGLTSGGNVSCGTIYNATTGMWELWIAGAGYNAPSISVVGNIKPGTTGVIPATSWVWSSTMPSGFVAVTEKRDWTEFNTTVDANGFIKAASPIVKLFGTGENELNDQSQGVTTERVSEGVYRVSGVLGFNGDGAWGGAGNGIEIPVDDNKRPLIWVESKVLPDGDIEIRTYHRTYDTGPYSARNIEAMDSGEIDKKKQPIFVEMPDGTPIDIPAGRWIDLRVEMPGGDEPEYEPVPEDKDAPEVTPEVTEPEGGEEQAPGETLSPIEEPKE
ncbi:TPA: prophage tail fiber N-terminal domain-containing protein [Serratia fonticola]